MFSDNPLFDGQESSDNFTSLDSFDDTRYSYFRETEHSKNEEMKTPRMKFSTQFDFDISNIQYPENLHTLYISKFYKSIKPELCIGFEFLSIVSFDISEIPDRCFENCPSLKSVKATNKLFKIGNSSFKNCSELSEIRNINQLYKIGFSAFENCKSLKQFIVARIIEHDAYRNTGIEVLRINDSVSDDTLKVEVVQDSVFKDCSELQSVHIYSVNLSNSLFRGCIKLQDFQTDARTIEKYTFVNTGFETLDIPQSVSIINEHALSSISTLHTIIVNNINLKIHYKQIFNDNTNLNIIINVKKSELNKIIKFIINNQQFLSSFTNHDILISRPNSQPLTDLKEMIRIMNLTDELMPFISAKPKRSDSESSSPQIAADSKLNENKFKIFYILIAQQYYIIEEESNIKRMVSRLNKSNAAEHIDLNELDILNANLQEKLLRLKEFRDIYDLYKSKLV